MRLLQALETFHNKRQRIGENVIFLILSPVGCFCSRFCCFDSFAFLLVVFPKHLVSIVSHTKPNFVRKVYRKESAIRYYWLSGRDGCDAAHLKHIEINPCPLFNISLWCLSIFISLLNFALGPNKNLSNLDQIPLMNKLRIFIGRNWSRDNVWKHAHKRNTIRDRAKCIQAKRQTY